MFKFLGSGSAFNPMDGNTSAFLKENDNLMLIDCGETVFEKIIANNLLDDIKNIDILITHLHPDHIGSLGSLIYYCFYRKNILLNIVIDKNVKYHKNLKRLLKIFGVKEKMFRFITTKELSLKYKSFDSVRFILNDHQIGMYSYGIEFITKDGVVFYSGDLNNLDYIKKLIIKKIKINKIYVESTFDKVYNQNAHISVVDLEKTIPMELRNKVYCMHFEWEKIKKLVLKKGFNIVQKI